MRNVRTVFEIIGEVKAIERKKNLKYLLVRKSEEMSKIKKTFKN